MHATIKITYAFIKTEYTHKNKIQIDKMYIPFYSPTHGEFENLYFVMVAPNITMAQANTVFTVEVNIIYCNYNVITTTLC